MEIFLVVATGDAILPTSMPEIVVDHVEVIPHKVCLVAVQGVAPTAGEVAEAFEFREHLGRTGVASKVGTTAGFADNTIWEKLRKWRDLS